MSSVPHYEKLTLASLVQAEQAFQAYIKRTKEVFAEQEAGVRAEGPVVFQFEVALEQEGLGNATLSMKSGMKEPKCVMLQQHVHDLADVDAGMQILRSSQPDLFREQEKAQKEKSQKGDDKKNP